MIRERDVRITPDEWSAWSGEDKSVWEPAFAARYMAGRPYYGARLDPGFPAVWIAEEAR